MKRLDVNADRVGMLARLAGFDFAAERCALLATVTRARASVRSTRSHDPR